MKQIKLLLPILVISTFFACKKQLNVYPTTSQVDGNLITDLKSATTVLNGVYYAFANSGTDNNNGITSIKWSTVNETMPSQLTGSITYSYGQDGFGNFSFNPLNAIIATKWNYGYNLVNSANGFLKNVEPVTAIPSEAKRTMIAEAKFLRAFANADLLLYFGQYNDVNSKYGIVLRDKFVSSGQINLPRTSVAAAYTAILKDLDEAIADLPALNTQIHYANSWAAKMLKARVLLNRSAEGDEAQVISLTDDIIKNGPFQLEAQLKDLFLVKGFTSKEVMLAVQPYPTESYKFYINNANVNYYATKAFKDLLLNDPRETWMYKNRVIRGSTLASITKYYAGSVTAISRTPLSGNSYAFRLTEAYLMQAEAIAVSGGNLNTAKTLLKTVLSHAGVNNFAEVDAAPNGEALQLLIVQEVRKNFFAENGLDWLALRRLPFAKVQELRPAIKSDHLLIFPIPLAEGTANDQVAQNPAY